MLGNDLHALVAVSVIVCNDQSRVLSLKRAAHCDAAPGVWEVISGRVNNDEQPVEAAHREVSEESGLKVVLDERPLSIYRAKRNTQSMVVIVYRARYVSGSVRLSHEHDDFSWCTLPEFRERCPFEPLVRAAEMCV